MVFSWKWRTLDYPLQQLLSPTSTKDILFLLCSIRCPRGVFVFAWLSFTATRHVVTRAEGQVLFTHYFHLQPVTFAYLTLLSYAVLCPYLLFERQLMYLRICHVRLDYSVAQDIPSPGYCVASPQRSNSMKKGNPYLKAELSPNGKVHGFGTYNYAGFYSIESFQRGNAHSVDKSLLFSVYFIIIFFGK